MTSSDISNQNCFHIFKRLVLYLLICVVCSVLSESEDSTWPKYSSKEQMALKQLRPLVSEVLYREYMKEDMYLVKWLRASEYNLRKADMMIRKTHQWRKNNSIDSILEEDWTAFEKEYPYIVDGQDLDGRPIGIIPTAWDTRKAVVSGHAANYSRNYIRLFETLDTKARLGFNRTSPSPSDGKERRDVADWIFILDMNGFNLHQHSCLACVSIEFGFAQQLDSYYASSTKSLFLVNMPRIFKSSLRLMLRLISQKSRDTLKVFDYDKAEYSSALLCNIAPDQLLSAYGGTRIRS